MVDGSTCIDEGIFNAVNVETGNPIKLPFVRIKDFNSSGLVQTAHIDLDVDAFNRQIAGE